MRPWQLNSADDGKWQVFPLEAAKQEMLLHLLPSIPFLGGTQGTQRCSGLSSRPQMAVFPSAVECLKPHKTELQPGLLVTQQLDGQPRSTCIFFSLWEQAARPKPRKDKINDFTPLTFSSSSKGMIWGFFLVLTFFVFHTKG